MNYTKFFAERVTLRKENIVRRLIAMRATQPNAISLAGGMPNPAAFPIKAMSVTYVDDVCENLVGEELNAALQYGPSQGYPPLLEKFREFQQKWHSPPRKDWDVVFTAGSQDGFCKVLELFLEDGEPIMMQVPAYPAAIGAVYPMALDFIGIQQDADGIIPEEIEKALKERIRKNQALPKLLYVNPVVANPTGSSLSLERMRKVYKLAQTYDFLIVEDDPYCFIHYFAEQPASFLSMDTDGRVIRLESFSKVICPGLRLGAVTANKEIIEKLLIHIQNSLLHASGISQMVLYKLFENWSHERFEQHFAGCRSFYKQKRDVMLAAAKKHLTGIAEWSVPKGGMFLWIKFDMIKNAEEITTKRFLPNDVFVVPGNAFNYDRTVPDQHLRFSYSFATSEEVDKALSVIAQQIVKPDSDD